MVYKSGQVECIFPYIKDSITTFILGGPADGDEAQLFRKKFPSINIFGFEPNRTYYQYQLDNNFPGELRPEALWFENGTHSFSIEGPGESERSSRLVSGNAPAYQVNTITLDSLFFPAVARSIALWIDIERSELYALHGAMNLLKNSCIQVILLEAFDDNIDSIGRYLKEYRMDMKQKFNAQNLGETSVFDVIFERR